MELLTESVKVFFDDVPARFDEVTRKAIRAWSSISWHFFDNIINFLFGERGSKQVQVFSFFDDIRKVKFHMIVTRRTNPVFVGVVDEGLFSSMVFHSCAIIKLKGGYVVSSVSSRSKGFKKFWILIPKLNPTNGASLLPILLLII